MGEMYRQECVDTPCRALLCISLQALGRASVRVLGSVRLFSALNFRVLLDQMSWKEGASPYLSFAPLFVVSTVKNCFFCGRRVRKTNTEIVR